MSGQLDLNLEPHQSGLLGWQSGESLYSLCSRHHAFWGHAQASSTARILFGNRRAGLQHDFPGNLSTFAARTGQALGEATEIAAERTLLRYFRPFMPVSKYACAIEAMCSSSSIHLKRSLGLTTSHFRSNHPLKFCRECAIRDQSESGWTAWHLEHQYPGVWVCVTHGTPLAESPTRMVGSGWLLPSPSDKVPPTANASPETLARWRSFATLTTHIVKSEKSAALFLAPKLRLVVRQRLSARGWLSASGQLRRSEISRAFVAYVHLFQTLNEFSALPRDPERAIGLLTYLNRSKRGWPHPLGFLLLIDWLFTDATDFFDAWTSYAPGSLISTAEHATSDLAMDQSLTRLRQSLLTEVHSGASIAEVSHYFDVSVHTARSWVHEQWDEPPRRKPRMDPKRYAALVADLEDGLDVTAAAAKHTASKSTVHRVLRSNAGLIERWHSVREDRIREIQREVWLSAQKQSPTSGAVALRASIPSTYAWLYRSDREWFEQQLGILRGRADQ